MKCHHVSLRTTARLVGALLALAVTALTTASAEPLTADEPTAAIAQVPDQNGPAASVIRTGFRGVFFNPNVDNGMMADYPYPVFNPYGPEYRAQIRAALQALSREAGINFIDVFLPIPFTLAHPPKAPRAGQPLEEWANMTYLDNAAVFVDDCHDAGISVEFDLADNRWIPFKVEPELHIGDSRKNPVWPVADDTPWDESATWYSQVIERIESRTHHPENIAMWCMMGHYQLGAAEPDLWGNENIPERLEYTEKFVKNVWPAFRSAGKRPKAAPILNPIFSSVEYWMRKSPEERLVAFTNLKQWLVDDLNLPPDYWVITTYPFCDPAPDGFHYLRRIVEILGKENAPRIISTDFKAIGIDSSGFIVSAEGHSPSEVLEWQFQKCKEYGFAGWWLWSYQDHPEEFKLSHQTGIRRADGQWKADLLNVVRKQAGDGVETPDTAQKAAPE